MAIETGSGVLRAVASEPRAAVAPGGDGKPLPPAGNDAPPRVEPRPIQAELRQAVENLNRFLAESQRGFVFRLDESTGRTVITIVNPSTGEIVREIPPPEVLQAARTLREAGLFLSARA